MSRAFLRTIVSVVFSSCLFTLVAAAQVQTMGDISFGIPAGWSNEGISKDHAALSLRAQGGAYWVIAVYQAVRSSGNPDADFAAAWRKIAPRDPVPEPIYEHKSVAGYSGRYGSQTTGDGQNLVWVYVLEARGNAIPVLVITQNRRMFDAMAPVISLVVESVRVAPDKAQGFKTTITLADLVGEWHTGGESSVNYVDSATGAYAGSSTVAHGAGYVIAANGTYTSKMAGVAGRQIVREQGSGTVEITGDMIVFHNRTKNNVSRYHFISYQTAVNGATVLTLLGDNYEATAENVSYYGEKWIRNQGTGNRE